MLSKVFIPNSVISIGQGAFSFCNSEIEIYCEVEAKPSGWDEYWNFDGQNEFIPVVWGYKE